MKIYVQKLFQPFYELPANLPSSYLRSYVFTNYAFLLCGILHFTGIFIFSFVGVKILALYNIASVVIWAFAIFFNFKGYIKTSFALANIEIMIHAWLCTLILGWNAGWHFYIAGVPLLIFLTPWPLGGKLILSAINSGLYLLLFYSLQYFTPSISIEPTTINAFNYLNIFFICFVFSYFAYHYRAAVIRAENDLIQEHRKTKEALIERDKVLVHLNEELAEAADYVKNMLPKPINEGPVKTDWRFIPSTSLGGDAFGYHWIDGNHFAIYLLDVSGHGVGAALLSVSVMNTLRSQTLPDTDFKDSKQVLESLNMAFPGEENNDMFFSIWYGVYNKNTRELTYASGGHPPALLLGGNTTEDSKSTLLRTPSYVVGGMSEATYEKKECLVGENDRLYIFSDGVYEVEKSDGSMWRFQEFTEFMNKVKTDGQSILEHLFHYAGNLGKSDNFEDDFTIVEVSFT
jgi:sigma-B regulation protein RsbU (phosphoserine phosphatase)